MCSEYRLYVLQAIIYPNNHLMSVVIVIDGLFKCVIMLEKSRIRAEQDLILKTISNKGADLLLFLIAEFTVLPGFLRLFLCVRFEIEPILALIKFRTLLSRIYCINNSFS